jgi:coatomer subunit beta
MLAVSSVRTRSFDDHATCSDYLTGEDALVNLSVERTDAGTNIGHVRIQSKTQGIALSLGDRITMCKSSATSAEESIR